MRMVTVRQETGRRRTEICYEAQQFRLDSYKSLRV